MKKILSTLLVALLVVSTFATFGASAATTDGTLGPINLTFSVYTEDGSSAVTTAEVDDVVLVKLNITNIAAVTALKYYKITIPANEYLDYTSNNISLTVGTAPGEVASATSSFGYEADGDLYGAWTAPGTTVFTGTRVISFKAKVKKALPAIDGFSIDVNAALSGTSYLTYFANTSSGSGGTTASAKGKRYAMTTTAATLMPPAVALPLVDSVTFTGKGATGSNYDVVLNGEAGTSYKAYVKDAVYGWTLVKAYGSETSFPITVVNPTTPFEIEVLETAGGTPTGTPTVTKTLAELGQVGITTFTLSASSYEVNSPIALGTVTTEIPATGTYRYELTLGDSGKSFSGLANAIAINDAFAKKPGTYKASLVIYKDGSKNTIFASKNFNYTVVDTNSVLNLPKYSTNNKLNAKAVGNAVTLNKPADSASVGAASYKYRYLSPLAGGISGSSYSNVLNIPSPGVYEVYADLLSGTVKADSAYSLVRVLRGSNEVEVAGFEGALANSANVGDTLTFTVDATNATQFMFVRRDASGYRTVKTWSSSDTWTWTPAKNGNYEIYAYAKAEGAGSYEAFAGKAINVGDVSGSAPVAVAASTDAKKANSLTITGTVGNLYAFEIIDTISNKYIFSGYLEPDSGNANKVVFPFVAEVAGREYKVTTYVRNANNSGAYDGKTTTTLSFN